MNTKRFSLAYLVLFGVVTFLCAAIPSSISLATGSTSAWNGSGVKIVDSNKEYTSEEVDRYIGAHGRQACEDKVIPIDVHYNETDCWYASVFGEFSDYGNTWKPYDNEFAGYMGPSANIAVVPSLNPSVLLEFVPLEDGGYQLNFRSVFGGLPGIYTQIDDGPTYYNWTTPPTSTFKNEDGSPHVVNGSVRYIEMWYDAGGRYLLIADKSIGAVTRVDLMTFKMLTVRYVDVDVYAKFASFDITSDGKKLIVNTFGQAPQLVHLDMCPNNEVAYVSEPLICEVTPLGAELEEFGVDSRSGDLAVFKDNTTIEWYGTVDELGTRGKLYIYAPGTWQENYNYIAMGDSFASGEGAGDYYAGTNKNTVNMCHLSKRSYPFLIGQELFSSTQSVACSGAVVRNIVGPGGVVDGGLRGTGVNQSESEILDANLGIWTPGRNKQLYYLNVDDRPGVITMSIGGNDIGFKNILTACAQPSNVCFDNESDREALVKRIDNQYSRLVEVYAQVRKSAALGAKIYVAGYPEAIASNERCITSSTGAIPFEQDERKYLIAVTRYMNLTIERAAAEAGVRYVDVSEVFYGQRLCESTIKPTAMNGARFRLNIQNIKDVVSPESFHPNVVGHELLAEAVIQQTDYLTLDNPRPAMQEEITREDAVTIGVLESLWDPGETRELQYTDTPTDQILLQGSPEDFQLGGGDIILQSGGLYTLITRSNPVELDTAIADENGIVTFNFTIPDTMAVGQHTLIVTGPNPNGGTLEIRMPYFVASSYEDWDGDGIRNEDQVCPYALKNPSTGDMEREWCIDESGVSIFETPEREENEPITMGLPGEEATNLSAGKATENNKNTNGGVQSNQKDLVVKDEPTTNSKQSKLKEQSELLSNYLQWITVGVAILFVTVCIGGVYYIKHRQNND